MQEDMDSVLLPVLYEGSLKGDANSHLTRFLWDEQIVHNIRIVKLIYILPTQETHSNLRG